VKRTIITFIVAGCLSVGGRAAQQPDGAAVFSHACAACHRAGSGTRAPLPEVLRQMTEESILRALESGMMKAQGSLLTQAERVAVARYLGTRPNPDRKPGIGYCQDPAPGFGDGPTWNGWSVDSGNTRFQNATAAGLDAQSVPKLKLRWAFGFPGRSSINSQPTVFGGRIFVGSEEGTVYSLDARSGCIIWSFKAQATVRAAVVIYALSRIALFGDLAANIYAVDALTGSLVWKRQVDRHPVARITGSPLLVQDRLYVPVSSGEEGSAADPRYRCCTFRGSVVALDARTGRQIWKAYTIPEQPHPIGANGIEIGRAHV